MERVTTETPIKSVSPAECCENKADPGTETLVSPRAGLWQVLQGLLLALVFRVQAVALSASPVATKWSAHSGGEQSWFSARTLTPGAALFPRLRRGEEEGKKSMRNVKISTYLALQQI